jgi:hypothetical protein
MEKAGSTPGLPPQPAVEGTGPNMFLVGVDIEPGTYKVEGQSMYHWFRLSCLDGSSDCIIEHDIFFEGGRTYVSILDTDKAFKLTSGPTTLTKVGD